VCAGWGGIKHKYSLSLYVLLGHCQCAQALGTWSPGDTHQAQREKTSSVSSEHRINNAHSVLQCSRVAHTCDVTIAGCAQYGEGWPASTVTGIPEKLLWKSAALHGFFLLRHASHFKPHLARLSALVDQGKLQVSGSSASGTCSAQHLQSSMCSTLTVADNHQDDALGVHATGCH
jgi:hypothetical protein